MWPRTSLVLIVVPTLGLGHPGNGIVALSANAALTGDAIRNALWRFQSGQAPRNLTGRLPFHCHWVTRGLDGRLYAETLSQRSGRWMQTVYRLDAQGGNPVEVASAPEGRFGVFAVDREGGIVTTTPTGLQVFRKGTGSPFRGSGRPARGRGSGSANAKARSGRMPIEAGAGASALKSTAGASARGVSPHGQDSVRVPPEN